MIEGKPVKHRPFPIEVTRRRVQVKQKVIQKAEGRSKHQRPNLTGIPAQGKMAFDQHSVPSFHDVRVHYSSEKPEKCVQDTQAHVESMHEKVQACFLKSSSPGRMSRGLAQNVVQMMIDPQNVRSWCKGTPPEYKPNVARHPYGAGQISGASRGGEVLLTQISSYHAPEDLIDMNDWKYYLTAGLDSVNLLEDPETNTTMTRMHVINGRFGGTGKPKNIVLGKQSDNLSHRVEVEQHVEKFFQIEYSGAIPYAVLYTVLPQRFGFPRFLCSVLPKLRKVDYEDFRKWVADSCPQTLECLARFYIKETQGDQDILVSPEQAESIPINGR